MLCFGSTIQRISKGMNKFDNMLGFQPVNLHRHRKGRALKMDSSIELENQDIKRH
jgi:hypothetical protein